MLSVPELLCHLLGQCVGLGAILALRQERRSTVSLRAGEVQEATRWQSAVVHGDPHVNQNEPMLAQPQGRVDLIWPQHHADMVAWGSFLLVMLVLLCTVNCCIGWTCWTWGFFCQLVFILIWRYLL